MEHSVSESEVSAVLNEFGLTTSQEVPHYMTQKVEKLEKFHLSILSLCTENHKHVSSQKKFQ